VASNLLGVWLEGDDDVACADTAAAAKAAAAVAATAMQRRIGSANGMVRGPGGAGSERREGQAGVGDDDMGVLCQLRASILAEPPNVTSRRRAVPL